MASGAASKPSAASSAASMPFCAARPGWKLFAIAPKCTRSPTGWVAAKPSVQAVRSASSPSSRAAAAPAPIAPAVPVMCQPAS